MSINATSHRCCRVSPHRPGSGARLGRAGVILAMLIAALLAAQTAPAAQWDTYQEASIGLRARDNATLERTDTEKVAATVQEFRYVIDKFRELDRHWSLTGGLDVDHDQFSGVERLSNTQIGVHLAARRKLGLGARAPWWRVRVGAMRFAFVEDVRDRTLTEAAFDFGHRPSTRFSWRARAAYEQARGTHSAVFDTVARSAQLDLNWQLNRTVTLRAGGLWRNGDITPTISGGPTAIPDWAWVGGSARTAPFARKAVYRVGDATTRGGHLGLAFAAGHNSAIHLTFERHTTEVTPLAVPWSYANTNIGATYVVSF